MFLSFIKSSQLLRGLSSVLNNTSLFGVTSLRSPLACVMQEPFVLRINDACKRRALEICNNNSYVLLLCSQPENYSCLQKTYPCSVDSVCLPIEVTFLVLWLRTGTRKKSVRMTLHYILSHSFFHPKQTANLCALFDYLVSVT